MGSDETITLSHTPVAAGAPEFLLLPRQLGNVRLIGEIGRGGMGVVWRGRDEMLARDVAVKFLLHAIADAEDPHFGRFLDGARAAAAVRHSGLTSVYHAELAQGVPYLVMEYISGPALSDILRQCGPLNLSAVIAVLDAVCAAVGALHEAGVLHRDIKPANVLLDSQGRVYVTDFGLACPRHRSLFIVPFVVRSDVEWVFFCRAAGRIVRGCKHRYLHGHVDRTEIPFAESWT